MSKTLQQLIDSASTFNGVDVPHITKEDYTKLGNKKDYGSFVLIKRENDDVVLPLTPYSIKNTFESQRNESDYNVNMYESLGEKTIKKLMPKIGQSMCKFEARGLEFKDLSVEEAKILKKTFGHQIDVGDMVKNKCSAKLITHVEEKGLIEKVAEKISDEVAAGFFATGRGISMVGINLAVELDQAASSLMIGAVGVLVGGSQILTGIGIAYLPTVADKLEALFDTSEKKAAMEIAEYREQNMTSEMTHTVYVEANKSDLKSKIMATRQKIGLGQDDTLDGSRPKMGA